MTTHLTIRLYHYNEDCAITDEESADPKSPYYKSQVGNYPLMKAVDTYESLENPGACAEYQCPKCGSTVVMESSWIS